MNRQKNENPIQTPPPPSSLNDDNTFPKHVMSGAAGHFAELYSNYMEAPVEFFYMAYLTCLGSILTGKVTLLSEIAPQPRLYTILLGESADDRKSTAIKKTVGFFTEVYPDFPISWGIGSAEGMQKKIQSSVKLLLCLDEFKSFVSKCSIQSSVLLPCVTTLFESNDYENQTKNSHIQLIDAHLSLLSASTVPTYEHAWKSSFTDIGFNNRLFIVPGHGKKRFSLPTVIPEREKEIDRSYLNGILHLAEKGLELSITSNGRSLYHEWYMGLEKSIHTKRLDTYALKFMILLSVSDFKIKIDEKTVKKAISLVNWQLEMRRQYDPIDAESNIAKMEEKIRRKLKQRPMTERELRQYTNANRNGLWVFNMALDNLKRAQDVVFDSSSRKFRLNQV